METTKIIIQRVTIYSFKNISNLVITLEDGENLKIEGENGLGKSNILNAIYWCFNGKDLSGCSDQSQFIPNHDKDKKVDVEVITNIGKIERIIETDAKGTVNQTVMIDDTVYTLKDYDIEIDKRFGLLPFTLNNLSNKDFNLREFLMNPTYMHRLTPKALRDVFAKAYSLSLSGNENYDTPVFNPLFINLLKDRGYKVEEIKNFYEPIETIAANLEIQKKELKKQLDDDKIVSSFLAQFGNVPEDIKSKLDYIDNECKTSLALVEENLMVLESGRQTWNEYLEQHQNFGSIDVKFQTITAKGIKKNAIALQDFGIDLDHVSTSENMVDSFVVAWMYKKAVGCHCDLPVFVDRAESVNSYKLGYFDEENQLLYTKVTTHRNIRINGLEVK